LWVIATLAGLVGLIVLVLCVPLETTFHVDVYGRPKFSVRLTWLFGLVSKEVKRGEKKPEEKKKPAKEKPKKKRRIKPRTILKILRTKGLLKQLKGLVRDMLTQLKIKELVVNLKLGLDDPADTGFLFALIGPATLLLNSLTTHQIRIQPVLSGEAFIEGFSHGNLRLRPIQLIPPFIKAIFSLATIRAVKTLVLSKWKRKK